MRPRGCLRPAPPSTECRGGRCALAAGRLPSGASLFGRVSMSGAVVRYPPLFADMTARRGFQVGCGPTPRGDASGARRRRGGHRPARAGLSPCPHAFAGGDAAHLLMSFFSRGVARDGCFIYAWFASILLITLANLRIPGRAAWTHSLPAAFAISYVQHGALHQLLRISAQPGRKRCSPAATDQP